MAREPLTVELDRERRLIVDLNAMVAFAELRGKEIWECDLANPNSSDLRAILWCALLRDDPQITLEVAGQLLTTQNMQDLTNQLMRTVVASLPTKEQADDGSPNAVKPNGTG